MIFKILFSQQLKSKKDDNNLFLTPHNSCVSKGSELTFGALLLNSNQNYLIIVLISQMILIKNSH